MIIRGSILIIVLILGWQITVILLQLPPYLLPSPWLVLQSFFKNYSLIFINTIPTVVEIITGLILGVLLGACLAIVMSVIAWLGFWLLPLMIISQAIPTFAIAPILVLWFGYGVVSKIITITLMLFFPVASALYYGLQQTPEDWLDLAKTMNAKRNQILWHLKLPAARSHFANGIRIATVLAPIGAIVSEWVGAGKGLGFLMLNANARLQIDLMFACLVTIIGVSLLLYMFVNWLLPQTNWKTSRR